MDRPDDADARRSSRVVLGIQIAVRNGGTTHRGLVQNLSLGGAAAAIDRPPATGTHCQVTLLLGDGDDAVSCELEADVVRCAGDVVHLAFTEVKGLDGLEHLHHLLLFNANDPDRVAGEFTRFLGLRPRA